MFFFLAVFFVCVVFFFLFCFSLHSITICPYAMVYLGHGFFFLSCTDGFFLGLCAWKCRAVPDSARLNGKVLMDGSTLKPKSGIRLLIFFFCGERYFILRNFKAYRQMWQHQSFVCLFWPEVARGKSVACFDNGMLFLCFCAWASRYLASIASFHISRRMIRQYLEIGPNLCLGGREDKKSTHPWVPVRTFLNAAKGFFCLSLYIDIGTLKWKEAWPMCITCRNSDLATTCRVQLY